MLFPLLQILSDYFLSVPCTGSTSERVMLREELYKWSNTMYYNAILIILCLLGLGCTLTAFPFKKLQ